MTKPKELPIITYPNPVLDKSAEEVTFPLDNSTKQLIADMWAVVRGKGVGLAAPQVGVSKKICIIHLDPAMMDKGQKEKDIVMINPKITFYSKVENLMVEGCLSFPEQFYEIWRSANIIVEYFNEKGKKKTLKAKNWTSRVIQHEVDHLNGDLFINKGGKKIEEDELGDKNIVD